MHDHLYAVIMAGGGGTRLWPLSRREHPKQMLRLVDDRTLFQSAVDRLLPLLPMERILVVTAAEQVEALSAQYPELPEENYIVEPRGRGTASCIGLSAIHVRHLDPEAIMIVVTADHHVEDHDTFTGSVRSAVAVAEEGYLVTLGVTPSYPATGYGYIRFGERLSAVHGLNVFAVAAFTEKPDLDRARSFFDSGDYAWNSGMFIWRVDRILQETARWMPALHAVLEELDSVLGSGDYQTRLATLWPALASETIDYGIMERADRVAVIPVDMGWSDIGTWSSVMEIREADEDGNVMVGDVLGIETDRTMVLSQGNRLVVVIGLDDVIVVDTPDAVLVTRRGTSEKVRDVISRLKADHREQML